MKIIVPFFDIIIRKNGEILIILPAYPKDAYQSPLFSFNKKDLGILYRDENQDLILTNFDKSAMDELSDAEFITFIEINKSGEVIKSYKSAVIIESDLK